MVCIRSYAACARRQADSLSRVRRQTTQSHIYENFGSQQFTPKVSAFHPVLQLPLTPISACCMKDSWVNRSVGCQIRCDFVRIPQSIYSWEFLGWRRLAPILEQTESAC